MTCTNNLILRNALSDKPLEEASAMLSPNELNMLSLTVIEELWIRGMRWTVACSEVQCQNKLLS